MARKTKPKTVLGRKERESNEFTFALSEYLENMSEYYNSQNACAEDIGINKATLSNYINNKVTPTLDTLYKLYRITGDSIDYMVGVSKCKSPNGNAKAILTSTGLSNKAYETLCSINKNKDNDEIKLLNMLLENEDFCDRVLGLLNVAYKSIMMFPRKNAKDTWIKHIDIIDVNDNGFLIDGVGFAKRELQEATKLFGNIMDSIIVDEWNKTLKGGK